MKARDLLMRTTGSDQSRFVTSFLTCLLILSSACTQTPTPTVQTVQFTIVADSSTAPLLEELVAAYLIDRSFVNIQMVKGANAERTLQALQSNQGDLASLSWLPEQSKIENSLWYRPYARDSIVVISHPTNPVGSLTLLQLREIFQGQTLLWSDLGGQDVDVIPVSREDGAGTRQSFESLVMGGRRVSPTAAVMPSNRSVVEYVSITPGAVGYVSPAWLAPSVNLLAVEAVTPSPASVEDGRYLLARPLYLVARAEPKDGLAAFVNWIKEGDGREVIKDGYALAP